MKYFIFILGFLCYFVINMVAGQQTWKEEGSNVMAEFSELYKEDIKLEKNQDNQNDKMNELEGLINQLKEKVTEQDGTIEWLRSKIVELEKLTVKNDERITINSGK